jgi:hypothetical protein
MYVSALEERTGQELVSDDDGLRCPYSVADLVLSALSHVCSSPPSDIGAMEVSSVAMSTMKHIPRCTTVAYSSVLLDLSRNYCWDIFRCIREELHVPPHAKDPPRSRSAPLGDRTKHHAQ